MEIKISFAEILLYKIHQILIILQQLLNVDYFVFHHFEKLLYRV